MREELPALLKDTTTPWQTLDVLYEEPHVERVWIQRGENRLYMHRIHPCEKAFFHPHLWPSAIHVLSDRYRMNVGFGSPFGPTPRVAATIDVVAGAGYEMLDPNGWHDVAPYGGPSLSLMLSGPPWSHAQKAANKPLEAAVRDSIIQDVLKCLERG